MYTPLWTSHGHWFGDGPPDMSTEPKPNAWCRGFIMCDKCGAERVAFYTQGMLGLWVEWTEWVQHVLNTHPAGTRDKNDLRLGQKLFNGLVNYHYALGYYLGPSMPDPFHDDNKVPAFLAAVDELWEQKWR